MDHPELSPSEKKPPRRRSVWKRIGLAFVGFVALFFAGLYVAGVVATNRWDAYVAAKRAAGEPLTFAEIEAALPEVADEGTAAALLESIADELDAIRGEMVHLDGANPDADARVNRALIPEVRELLTVHADLLTMLSEVDQLPPGRIYIPLDGPPDVAVLPDLKFLRTTVQFIRLDASRRLLDDDRPGAVQAAERVLMIARTLRPGSTIIVRLIELATINQALEISQGALDAGELDDATLQRLTLRIREAEAAQSIHLALLGERAVLVGILDAFSTGQSHPEAELYPDSLTSPQTVGFYHRLPTVFLRSNSLKAAGFIDRLLEVADDPQALIKAGHQNDQDIPAISYFYRLAWILTPSLSRACILHVRIIAALRSADAALAAERFRLATGRFPMSFDELVPTYLPAVPIDPFTGTPLLLLAKDSGIVVYSVNDDGVDDSGQLVSEKGQRHVPDVGFRLLAPNRRGLVLFDPEPDAETEREELPMPPRAPLKLMPDNPEGTP